MINVSTELKPIGYLALVELLNLKVIPHFRWSYITVKGGRQIITRDYYEQHIYPKNYALKDDNDPLLQLEFAIKHDGINLEILKQVFLKLPAKNIKQYIKNKPTSKYARKIWCLYEMLTNKKLDIADVTHGPYFNLLDPKKYYTCTIIKSRRYRINDNLLGVAHFCPIIRKTEILNKFENMHLDKIAKNLFAKYDPSIIARATYYLYTKETMSSYEIEHERPNKKRIARFIELLQQIPNLETIDKNKLIELQNNIVDPRFIDVDYRHNQNYVGEQINSYRQKLHYISPKPNDVASLMQGLLTCMDRMLHSNLHPVIIAAAISFGLVFIHPFEDGNGRLHRFMVHYILSHTNFTSNNIIFPISATMLKNIKAYDAILESFSIHLLSKLNDYMLDPEGKLTVNEDSLSYYQYIDYTKITEYLFACINTTIVTEFKEELNYLVNYSKTKQAIQDIVDMPDKEIDRIIKFITQNNGKLSATKRQRYFMMLTEAEISAIETTIDKFIK